MAQSTRRPAPDTPFERRRTSAFKTVRRVTEEHPIVSGISVLCVSAAGCAYGSLTVAKLFLGPQDNSEPSSAPVAAQPSASTSQPTPGWSTSPVQQPDQGMLAVNAMAGFLVFVCAALVAMVILTRWQRPLRHRLGPLGRLR